MNELTKTLFFSNYLNFQSFISHFPKPFSIPPRSNLARNIHESAAPTSLKSSLSGVTTESTKLSAKNIDSHANGGSWCLFCGDWPCWIGFPSGNSTGLAGSLLISSRSLRSAQSPTTLGPRLYGVTEWGTPWSRSTGTGDREGGGITRPKLFKMTSPGDSEPKKRLHDPYITKMQTI